LNQIFFPIISLAPSVLFSACHASAVPVPFLSFRKWEEPFPPAFFPFGFPPPPYVVPHLSYQSRALPVLSRPNFEEFANPSGLFSPSNSFSKVRCVSLDHQWSIVPRRFALHWFITLPKLLFLLLCPVFSTSVYETLMLKAPVFLCGHLQWKLSRRELTFFFFDVPPFFNVPFRIDPFMNFPTWVVTILTLVPVTTTSNALYLIFRQRSDAEPFPLSFPLHPFLLGPFIRNPATPTPR